MTVGEIKEDVLFLLLAGSETVGHHLLSTITRVASDEAIKCKLIKKISKTFVTTAVISSKQTITLPYLQAVVREDLRYDPAVSSYLPRFPSNSDPVKILGYDIPSSVEITCDIGSINRSKKTFGNDADLFQPDRYVENIDGGYGKGAKEMEKNDLGFGYGRRRCMAKDMSSWLLRKVVFEFLRKFDVELLDEGLRVTYMILGVKGVKGVKIKLGKRTIT